jgi:ferritin-like protein
MALSKQTLEHLLEAESHLRSAIKSAAVNEKPTVIQQISNILLDIEKCKKFEEIMDMLDTRKPGTSGNFGSFLDD